MMCNHPDRAARPERLSHRGRGAAIVYVGATERFKVEEAVLFGG